MAYFPKNEIEINWCMFGQEVPETLINKGFQRFRLGFNSCRPHQNGNYPKTSASYRFFFVILINKCFQLIKKPDGVR